MRRPSTEVIPTPRERPEDVALRARLKPLVAAKRLQLKEIAAAIKVNTSAVCMAWNGQIQLPPAWIPQLARLLEVEATYLRGNWRPRRGGCEKGEKRPRHGPVPKRKNPVKAEADHLLANRLRELLAQNPHVRHKELAAYIGVVQQFFAAVLHERAPLPRSWLKLIAAFFEITVAEFVGDIPWAAGL
jgi:hypothetical protein